MMITFLREEEKMAKVCVETERVGIGYEKYYLTKIFNIFHQKNFLKL